MRIAVCVKAVAENEDVQVNADNTLTLANNRVIGSYDLNAVEAAVQLKESGVACEIFALTICSEEESCSSKIRKSILSKGPDELFVFCDQSMYEANSLLTARALQALIEKIGNVDLVLCGEGSSDLYSQITGSILGGLLGWPTLNGVNHLQHEDNSLIVERDAGLATEEYSVPLPAVLMVTSDCNVPRIATMKEILAAGKKPTTVWQGTDMALSTVEDCSVVSVIAPERRERQQQILKAQDDGALAGFAQHLRATL